MSVARRMSSTAPVLTAGAKGEAKSGTEKLQGRVGAHGILRLMRRGPPEVSAAAFLLPCNLLLSVCHAAPSRVALCGMVLCPGRSPPESQVSSSAARPPINMASWPRISRSNSRALHHVRQEGTA